VDGQGTISGQARAIDLGDPGSSKDITIVVTAPNGSLKSYLVTVVRAALGGNFNLGKLTVSPGTLDPSFKANTTRYTVNVGSGTDRVVVTATPQESSSTLQVNGQVANSGQARTIDLQDPGLPTDIEVLVIAQNGSRQPYVITMNRAALSADNNLKTLSVTPGTLAPAFAQDQLPYTVDVATGVSSLTITATVQDSNASLMIDGQGISSGQPRKISPLAPPGSDTLITILVRAPSGAEKTYTVTVKRPLPSSDAALSALTVSAGTLNPSFAAGTLNYTVNVPASVDSLTVPATKSDPNAVASASGSVIAPPGVATGSVSSALGLGTTTLFTITVTAQDGVTTRPYTVNVFRDSR
jgi:hypothetical protein